MHDARLGAPYNALPVDLGELMSRLLPLALAQTQQGCALKVIPRAAFGPPWKGEVAVLADLDACLIRNRKIIRARSGKGPHRSSGSSPGPGRRLSMSRPPLLARLGNPGTPGATSDATA